jgi:phospholipase C
MVYFDYHSIPGYWDYAEEYGIGDNYYAPVLGTTTPNRLMLLSGDTSVSANYGPPPYIPYSHTVMRQLDDAGVSWGYYDYIDAYGGASNTYPLNYFTDRPPRALANTMTVSLLFQQLTQGTGLPSVSFVNSLGNPELDEHPSYSPTTGELWTVSVINQVMKSVYWQSTAIFITWDEGGGYYDHVLPPKEFSIDHDFTHPLLGLGQRVPLMVISPYARENFVSHDLLSHLSLLKFIEYNWNLTPPNELVSESNLPLSFFNFSQPPRTPIILGSAVTYPIPLQGQENELSPSFPVYYAIPIGVLLAVAISLLSRKAVRRGSRFPNS